MLVQQVLHAVDAESFALGAGKQQIAITSLWLSQPGFQDGVRPASRHGGADQLAKRRCRPSEGDPFPSTIETDPRRLHDRRQ